MLRLKSISTRVPKDTPSDLAGGTEIILNTQYVEIEEYLDGPPPNSSKCSCARLTKSGTVTVLINAPQKVSLEARYACLAGGKQGGAERRRKKSLHHIVPGGAERRREK